MSSKYFLKYCEEIAQRKCSFSFSGYLFVNFKIFLLIFIQVGQATFENEFKKVKTKIVANMFCLTLGFKEHFV